MACLLASASSEHFSRGSNFSNAANQFSITGWVYLVSLPGNGETHWIGGMDAAIVCGVQNSGGTIRWVIRTGAAVTTGSATPATDTWYHIGFTRGTSGTVKTLYIDGVSEVSVSDAATGATTVVLGCRTTGDAASAHWDGRLADIKIYDGVTLTVDEINSTRYQYMPITWSTAFGWYPFLTSAGLFNIDFSANARNLVQVGGAASLGPPAPYRAFKQRHNRLYAAGIVSTRKRFLTLLGVS